MYHRDEGKIVKERDDLISATRYGVMMRRFAETEPRKRERVRVQTKKKSCSCCILHRANVNRCMSGRCERCRVKEDANDIA
jgi:hypothetical protein